MRDRDQTVLDAIAGRNPNGKGHVRANCPFCETVVQKVDRKQCLAVDLTNGWWRCFRCDTKGRLEDFDTGDIPKRDVIVEEKPPVNLPEGFVPLWTEEGQASMACAPARKYLKKHRVGVTARILKEAGIGACVRGRYRGRVVVPLRKAGKLVGCMTRVWKKKAPPGVPPYLYTEGLDRATTIYNEDALYVTSEEPAIIVEGCFDTYPFYPNGCALLGKTSMQQVDMMLKARRPLLIVFDGDAHREATALAMRLRLEGKEAVALRMAPRVDPDEVADYVKEQARLAFA